MQRQNFLRFLLLTLVCSLYIGGCTAHVPSGKWEVDTGVKQAFEAGTVFPDHTYYYLGSITAPDSIIAISNQYSLRTRVWAQIDMSEKVLNGWLSWYRTEYYGPCEYRGGVILTPDGRQAGFWYSQNIINIIEMPEPGVLVVFQPTSLGWSKCGEQDRDFHHH